ncbi:MAG: polysaccharide deacetylase [Pseudomonadota bacterium]
MSRPWRALAEELARWRDAGRTAELWWRDDDAARPDPALARLLALAERSRVPLALAVVPLRAERGLFAGLGRGVSVLQHGTDHVNRAAAGEKKTEFPAGEPAPAALERLARARERLQELAGERFMAVLAPPWNRLAPRLLPRLGATYAGLSQYGARKRAEPSPGLRQVNTHADIIAWQSGRGFAGEEAAMQRILAHLGAKRAGAADASEPTGLLTHHARHDAAAWDFIERLFDATRGAGGVWRDAAHLFR